MTTPPTSTVLRTTLTHLTHDANHLALLLPTLHQRHRTNNRDGLRSIAPTGTSRPTDTPNPTANTAIANITADDRTPWITPSTPAATTIDHAIRCTLRAADLLAEAVRAMTCIDPTMAPERLPACQTCYRTIIDREARRSDTGKPQCTACYQRTRRHTPDPAGTTTKGAGE